MSAKITIIPKKFIKFAPMKQNNSQKSGDSTKIIGVIFLALLWIVLVWQLFVRGGINLKNLLVAAFSGIIIIYPLWKRYLQPLWESKKKK